MMGTRILKIDAEMAEKIEVLHRFSKSLCPSSRGDPEDSETPPNINFLMSIDQENGKKQSGTKTAFLN